MNRTITGIAFIAMHVALFVIVTHGWWVEAFSRMFGG